MFTGTTPPEVRLLLQDLMNGTPSKDVFIGYSGNYTVDKIMSKMGFRVHSNDVCLYSKLVADLLLGTDTEVKVINPELVEAFKDWPESKYKKLIQVMFTIRLSSYEPRKNDFQKEFFDVWVRQSGIYYENTIKKLEKGPLDFQIDSFFFGDFIEFLKSKKGKGVGVSFPPTYKSGYEKMFSLIESSFEYERAKYELFDPKKANTTFLELLEEDENVIYSDVDWPDLKKYEVGVINLGQGKHPVFIYSSVKKDASYYLEREKQQPQSKIQVLPLDYEFTRKTVITTAICPVAEINYFKAFYMANKVNYTTGGDLGLVFMADGKAFGFASFSKMLSTQTLLFMQSDFVVNSHTKRLSKLLISLARSREVRKLLARKLGHYYAGLKTTVYSDKPVSMKYRGVFDLERRDKGKLMYTGTFNELSLNEIYLSWLKKQKN